jgi:hypothetical protein
MGVRTIELRWRGRCSRCRSLLGAGEVAHYDDATHEISCVDCRARARTSARAVAERRAAQPGPGVRARSERERVQALIADARAALEQARHAS